jgi:UDPglucose 6-dehydrogenase
MAKITIVGNGWVGSAVKKLFPDAYVYTRHEGTQEEANKADFAFVAVPTPLSESGKLDTSAVEDSIKWLEVPIIIVRSTVNPGECDKWSTKYNKKIVFQPEYLGETPNHPLLNENNARFLILGGDKESRRKVIELYQTVYNANIIIRQVSLLEAEIIKLSENRAIAFKVMQCQELYDACQAAGVDYYTIRDAVYGDDPRFNLWWTFIFTEDRGFHSSKCLRKDVPAWNAWAREVGINPELTSLLFVKSGEYARR